MNNLFETDDDLIDLNSVVGGVSASTEMRPEYKAWHKPRKQWVREKQWWDCLVTMLSRNEREFANVEIIKYFGLPGGDLLDIEYFCQKFLGTEESRRKQFLFHGITNNEEDKNAAESRLSKIYDYPFVNSSSKVEKYEFSALEDPRSLIWGGVEKNGFFHMINLDFCDSLFKNGTLEAMIALLSYQFNHKNGIPWLLCLTTRIDKSGISSDLLDKLKELIVKYTTEEGIREDINQRFQSAYDNITNILFESTTELVKLSDMLQVCFVLWIIENAFSNQVKVELCSSARYNVHSGNDFPDMSSLVFRFTHRKPEPRDETGLVTVAVTHQTLLTEANKITAKKAALRKIAYYINLDSVLRDDRNLFEHYAMEMKLLLTKCGWNVDGYDEFISNN
ncbi:TPA: hypothetical protein U2J52_002880 [Providencia rettgeri]|uniref:PP_RS20740 family protein n=1 Tax=Providencia TaxID=586 RepID=UPI001CA792BC|nr:MULTISPECIES: hypothetical protein [Providencia]MCL0020807.1 hypothetical protein [Providencia rettgeri]QZY64588.1 hypothetical protein K7H99_00575 [Providencia rettgeri]HEM7526647.1 hypothetical protein [Providencia rettgeri]